MFPYTKLAEDMPWQAGPYEGVSLKVLHKNDETGGVVVLRRFASGVTVPAHSHPLANEWAWILSGTWEENGVEYVPGTLFFAPKASPHGPHVAKTEVVSLTVFDGPLSVV